MALLKTNTGIGTTNPTSALHVIGDGLFTGVVTATTFSGQINSGVGTFTNLTATNATLTNINSSGISTLGVTTVTRLTAQSINSSGIVTGSTFRPSSGYIQSPNGTNAFYIYDGTGNVAFQGTIGASQVNNASGFKVIGFAGTDITFENNAYVAGVTTSVGGFVGNLTGIAASATQLVTPRTFEITGDVVASPVSFDGTGNVSLAATIQPNSVALGSDTTGDYVQSVSGTASQITVTGGTGEGSTPVIAIANNATLPGNVTIGNDLQINNNLNVTGNITVGGTTGYIIVNDFRVKDADIVLGFTTDSSGNDVSNDSTANHGGISVASTVGTPLVQIYNPGIGESTLPTYKKIMWFQSGAFAGLNTDAWLINYAVGIGSTQFPSGTRLAAGSVQFTERDLAVVRNINASGIVTAVQFIGTASTASFATTAYNLTDAANITTGTINPARLSGTYNIDISGNAATATYATSAGVATYASSAGIATYATNAGVATYATSAGVATYASNAGVATYASASGVSTSVIGGIASVTQLSVSGISTLGVVTATQLYVSGVTTSVGGFVGNLTGAASTASFATTSSYLSDANNILSGTINVARLSGTYDININGNATTANYATNAGVATNVIGGIASVTQLSVSGVSTLGTVQVSSGIITATSGIITYYGDGSNLQGVIAAAAIGVQDEGVTVGAAVTTLNFSGATISVSNAVGGISTVTVVESGIANYALVAGIATYATSAGVATYASNAGVSTNVIGGIASVTQLSVSGVSTFNNNVFVGSGITMYAATGIVSATAFYGNGQNLSDIIAAKIAGISIFDEGTIVGSAFQYSGVNFVGDYVAATGIGTTATITFTTPPYANVAGVATYATNAGVATNVIGGIASVTQLSVSGISTLGFVTAGNIFSTGIVTALSFVGNLTGTATTASFATTAFTLNGTSETNLSVGFARSAGIATNLRGGVAGNVPYQSAVDTTAFVSNGLSGQVLLFNGSIPIWGNVSAASGAFGGISVQDEGTPVGTANSITTLNFVSPNLSVTATSGANGIATITMSDNIVGSALSISGISTLGVTSTTNLNAQQLNVSGVSTFAGVTTHTAPLFGTQASFTGVVTASSFSGNASSATYATNAGVATYASTAGIATYATNAGVATYASTAGVATALQNARDFSITGSFVTATAISFNGTGNVALAATITPDSIGLGTYTTGDYVRNISGTSNQITVTGGTGEGSTPTLSLPNTLTAPQDVTVTRDLQVNRNLNVNGNITIGGTAATIFSSTLNIFDPDIVLGYRTDANGNDISTDNTANHGGIAIASTEGNPLVQLFIAGIETNPATYKKIMWFKSGTFSGLNTDAWLSNYAIGIGSTQFPTGTRLAAGSVQFTENDLAVVRNINASGISTFAGITTNTSTLFANQLSVAGVATFAGITTVTGTTLFARQLSVSGVSTIGNFRITPVGSGATVGGIGVTYFGDGSQLSNIVTGIAVTANTTNQNQLIPYTTSFGSTTGFGATSSGLVFNPSTTRLGIGTTNPLQNLHVAGNLLVAAGSATTQHITQKAYELEGGALSWEGSAGQLFSITNNLTSGSIFSVNDVSGIPSIDVNADGTVTLAPYADGNVGIATTRPTSRLHVVGDILITGFSTLGTGATVSQTLFTNQLSVSGVSTFAGITTNTSTLFANQLSVAGVSTFAGITTVTGTTLFARQLNVSGVSTFAGITTVTSTLFATQLNISGVSTIGNFRITPVGSGATVGGIGVTYFGDGSNLTGVSGGVSISTNTTNQNQLITYATSFGSTTGFGATSLGLVFNPSTTRLGIGTTNPQYNLHVIGDFAATSKSFVINHPTKDGKKLRYASLEGPENGVYVRGRTQDAVIELPDYWTGLIDENSITVNLTSIGDSAMPRVESIGNNVINVFSKEEGDLDYYYTVYAERKDIEKLVVEY